MFENHAVSHPPSTASQQEATTSGKVDSMVIRHEPCARTVVGAKTDGKKQCHYTAHNPLCPQDVLNILNLVIDIDCNVEDWGRNIFELATSTNFSTCTMLHGPACYL